VEQTAWTFTHAVPFAKLNDILASLTAVQQRLEPGPQGAAKASVNMSFQVQGSQVSPELQASQPCPLPALVGDARAQAQELAKASGLAVGPIVAISDGSAMGVTGAAIFGIPSLALFPVNIAASRYTYATFLTPAPNWSLVVQFKLLH
jgi:hypothetical protein